MINGSHEWTLHDTRSSIPLTRNRLLKTSYHWDQEVAWTIAMGRHTSYASQADLEIFDQPQTKLSDDGLPVFQSRWNEPSPSYVAPGPMSNGLQLPNSGREAAKTQLAMTTILPTLVTVGIVDPTDGKGQNSSWPRLPSRNRDPWIGRLLGPFRLERLIGQGGSSRVYEARHLGIVPRSFAIKLFTKWSDANYARFENEARALEQLDHPGLVSVISAGQTYEGVPFLVMKLVNGQRLDDWVHETQSCPRSIVQVIVKVAQAMAVVHRQKLLHRDLKPSNIVMSTNGWPVVTDFGLAKKLANEDSRPLTESGQTMGSIGFLAPELSQTEKPSLSPTIDVYGLGATLYYLLTGKTPACSTDWWKCLDDLRLRDAVPVRRLNPQIPEDLESICMRCLEKNPTNRYEDMDSLADDLQRWLDHEPVIARPIGPLSRFSRWCRREPKLACLTLTICLLLLISTTIFATLWRQSAKSNRLAQQTSRLIMEEFFDSFEFKLLESFQVEGSKDAYFKTLMKRKKLAEQLIIFWPQDYNVLHALAETKYLVGRNARCKTQGLDPIEELTDANRIFTDLALRFPETAQYRFDQFHCYLALSINSQPTCEDRCKYQLKAFEVIDSLVEEYPMQPDYRDALALQCILMAENYLSFQDVCHKWNAITLIERGLRIAQWNVQQFPDKPLYRKHIVGAYRAAAELHSMRNNYQQARLSCECALNEARELYRLAPEISDLFLDIALIHQEMANIAMDSWDFDESDTQFGQFTEIMAAGGQAFPGQDLFHSMLMDISEKHKEARAQKLREYFSQK